MKTKRVLFASVVAGAALIAAAGGATAQMDHSSMPAGHAAPDAHETHDGAHRHESRLPTLPGQDAFGTIQEVLAILEADPATDWSRVDISALREHLVDMNLLVMDTTVHERTVEGGLEMTVTGQGRTLQAIRNMVPVHAPMIDGLRGWTARAEVTADGAKLTVAAREPGEIVRIRGLGFYGLMATGAHHQRHHLDLARGEGAHAHHAR
jgi:hypothetical protein